MNALTTHEWIPQKLYFWFLILLQVIFWKMKYTKPETYSINLFPNSYQSDASFSSVSFFWEAPRVSWINQYSRSLQIKLFLLVSLGKKWFKPMENVDLSLYSEGILLNWISST